MASSKSVWRAQEPIIFTCSLCDSDDNINWYCNDCQEALCDRCKEGHIRESQTKNDDVVSIRKANRHEDKPIPEVHVCTLHPDKVCELYCADCKGLFCSICVSKTHKHHNWKHFEGTFPAIQEHLNEHVATISEKVELFQNEISKRHRVNKANIDKIDTSRKEVNSQRTKLIAEVNSIADAVLDELSALENKESAAHQRDCRRFKKNIRELTILLDKVEVSNESRSIASLLEVEKSLRTTLSSYDVNVKVVSMEQPKFAAGSINRVMLMKMLGELRHGNHYQSIDVDSKHVQCLSKFSFTQQKQIFGICPVNGSHAWLSMHLYKGLVLVRRDGKVIDTVKLSFFPYKIAMFGTGILMTSYPNSSFVYKLLLHNRQVRFTDISPHEARDISINKTGEVCVSTGTDIIVLDLSGTTVRKLTCSDYGLDIFYLSSAIAVSECRDNFIARKVIIRETHSGATIHTWSGELDNGQKATSMHLCKMACDKDDRLFVPDFENHQVYVLPRNGSRATCLLDQSHGVVNPMAVGVDASGHVWIGCNNGTVHVMHL
ncbi:uncharacterized protein LOC117343808 [Pecten maximus]|uniref:uncharacterized protein LOC117343808 n=1 Tax=Pecten maximus TaxID=6579 RepID=UPI001458461D|nr:uncharacterized protein LOC117343808 [Pecten maximus]